MTEDRIVTLVRPLQPSKAFSPMEVTEFGIFTLVRPLQPSKAFSPMNWTEFPIIKLVRPLQSEKAPDPIDLTEFGIVTLTDFCNQKGTIIDGLERVSNCQTCQATATFERFPPDRFD